MNRRLLRAAVSTALLTAASELARAQGRSSAGVGEASHNDCVVRVPSDTVKALLSDSTAPRRWSAEQRQRIARHELCPGMTADMMQQSWGDSGRLHVSVPPAPGDTTFQYFYTGATVVVVNGIVRAIRPPVAIRKP
jgi:hypothetical protein